MGYFFHSVVCQYDGLALYSKVSLTSNEGMDGTGENCGSSMINNITELKNDKVVFFPDIIKKKTVAEKALKKFYKKLEKKPFLLFRVKNVLKKEGLAGFRKRLHVQSKK